MASLNQKWYSTFHSLLGFIVTGIGMCALIDQYTLQLIRTTAGPKYGPMISNVILIGAGVATAWRQYAQRGTPAPSKPIAQLKPLVAVDSTTLEKAK